MNGKRRICVFTSTRADYGLLYWLMRDLADDPAFELQVLVTGTHLVPQFGETWKVIAADGLPIAARVEMVLDSDTGVGMATSLGLGVIKYAETLARLAPDILVVLGDRYEILAAASAALALRIPVAHLHGGEVTEGAVDEYIRHAVTQMAALHFPAAPEYARRIRQMGVAPDRIVVAGAPGIDNLTRLPLLARAELEEQLGFSLGDQALMVTFHPATASVGDAAQEMAALLAALDDFPQSQVVITKANADPGGRAINALVDEFAAARPGRVLAVTSLGQVRYLSALKAVAAVVGNSSSGIIEAPAAGTPVVNIGSRQEGRLRAPAIIDCPPERTAIAAAIARALAPEFRRMAAAADCPYGRGDASRRIVEALKVVDLAALSTRRFHDLPVPPCP